MSHSTSDPDLLFGILARQNGLINEGQLASAIRAWTLDRSRPLADHLMSRGISTPSSVP